ncbi:MAG: Ni/Fe-hydrogenase cytochrome b subunit [Deltaproteobacteria bacterium]|nr:MAG: Ni/Fe-hydrogenase cytochrome b subunit [Deltaproteobacteria bacterium]
MSAFSVTHEAAAIETAPIGGRLVTRFTAVLGLIVGLFAVVVAVRFARGIGAVTNLNDGYPWGLWIVYDDFIGTALGASGFIVAFVTYILNRGAYHPMVRPALMTALFGYIMASLSVFFDIGRYWNAWHLFLPRYAQIDSVLWQVAMCIMVATAILLVEVLPVVLERFGKHGLRRKLDRVMFLFIAFGVVVAVMQQSAFGTLLVIFGPQIDPIYQTDLLPILFLTSTIGMGLAAVTLEGSLSALALRRPLERELLGRLMKVGQAILAIFLVARFADLAVRGVLPRVFQPTTVAIVFWIESALFAAPLVLLLGKAGQRAGRLFVAAMTMAIAGMMYRFDAYLVAYHTGPGWHYFPSLGEMAITVGLIALEILAFILVIRLLPVLPRRHPSSGAGRS